MGSICATNSLCVATPIPTTSASTSSPKGCATSQFSCAVSQGGGCCRNGATCASSSTTLLCVGGTTSTVSSLRTGTNSLSTNIAIDTRKGSLSTGAEVGIGIVLVLGILIALSSLLYWCLSRRRGRSTLLTTATGPQYGGTETIQEEPSGTRQGQHAAYFEVASPEGHSGQYNETGTALEDGLSPSADRGVPVTPQGPEDITSPVEIGAGSATASALEGKPHVPVVPARWTKGVESVDERVELE